MNKLQRGSMDKLQREGGYHKPSPRCPKCGATSGDDWSQCQGSCPIPGSPHHNPIPRKEQWHTTGQPCPQPKGEWEE